MAFGQIAAELAALGLQVLHLGAVGRWPVETQGRDLLIGQRQLESVAKRNQVGLVKLLLTVRGHLALTGAAHPVALLGVSQNHRRLPLVLRGSSVGGVNLHDVVAAALEAVYLLVRHALGQRSQGLVLTKKCFAVVAAVFRSEGLHLAIDGVGKGIGQGTAYVAGKQTIPVATPHQFDDVPAGAGKEVLQLINDAAIAAHRSVKPLQVAIDHPHQVVQLLARGQR